MKTNRFGFLFLTVTAFLMLCLCVGCESNIGTKGEEQAFIKFSEDGAVSRTLGVDEQSLYPIEKLYWAYVAVKKDGLNTLGESEETTAAVSDGKIVAVDTDGDGTADKNYVLRAVNKGPLTGLDVEVGPISYGDWLFVLYGYESWDETSGKFTNLIYTGKTVEKTVRINAPATGTFTPVNFVLTKESSLKGRLAFSNIYITVPENMVFHDSSTFTVSLEKTDGTKIAKGTGLVSGDATEGTRIPVYFSFESGVDGIFDAGQMTFNIKVNHEKTTALKDMDIDFPEVVTVNVLFSPGKISTLYGDLFNIKVSDERAEVQFGIAVACSGLGEDYREYYSLGDAVESGVTSVTLLRNIDDAGSVYSATAIYVNTNDFFVKNLTFDGTGAVSFQIDGGWCHFGGNGGTLNYFGTNGSTVWVDTSGNCSVYVNTGSVVDVYHSGTADFVRSSVPLNATKGYHLGTSYVREAVLAKGYLEIGANAGVGTMRVTANAGQASLKGNLTSVVSNIYRTNIDLTNGTYASTSSDNSGVYRAYMFNGNGQIVTETKGGTESDTKWFYGIEGMYITLPELDALFELPERPTFSQIDFLGWSKNSAGTGALDTNTAERRFVCGTAGDSFYAMWGAPVGGKIFYIDTTVTDYYKFYTKSGTTLTAATTPTATSIKTTDTSNLWYTLTEAADAVACEKDRYWVYNASVTRMNTDAKLQWVSSYFDGGSSMTRQNFSNYTSGGKTYTIQTDKTYGGNKDYHLNTMGMNHGHKNTEYILHLGDIYGTTGHTGKLYDPAVYKNGGIWTTVWNVLSDFRTAKTGGCSDWYIPSSGELTRLILELNTLWGTAIGGAVGTGVVYSSTPAEYTSTDHRSGTVDAIYNNVASATYADGSITHQAWRMWCNGATTVYTGNNRMFVGIRSF